MRRPAARAATLRSWRAFVIACMAEARIGRAELARRMGVPPSRVSSLLGPRANPTLRTVSDVALACGVSDRVRVRLVPLEEDR